MGCSSSDESSGSIGARKKGVIPSGVEFWYLQGMGRSDPLHQMFEYHGQPYTKIEKSNEDWEAQKARGDGGEFGGGLPQAVYTDNGKKVRIAQMGAILRHFGIRYGYYDTRNFKSAMYIDPVVDTFADQLNFMTKLLFSPPEAQAEAAKKYCEFAVKFHGIVEKALAHHGGKFAAGNNVTIADFILASHIGNYIDNASFPISGQVKALLDSTPKFKQYCQTVRDTFPFLKTRKHPLGPF